MEEMEKRFPRKLGLLHISHKKQHFVNCSRHAVINVLQYETLFTLEERRHGAILFHTFICLYCFGALALLCDQYFCASLEKLCKRWANRGTQTDFRVTLLWSRKTHRKNSIVTASGFHAVVRISRLTYCRASLLWESVGRPASKTFLKNLIIPVG